MKIQIAVILSEAKDLLADSSAFGLRMTLFGVFFLFSANTSILAANSESTISSRLTRLIEQVDQLEKKQQQIIVTENKIVDEIKNLKIQSRR